MGDTGSDFKEAVKAYCAVNDEIVAAGKKIRELRKQKDTVGEVILAFMRNNSIDVCELPDGKLTRRVSKRTETLKKEHILKELASVLDDARALNVVNNIFANRAVVEKDTLTRTVKKH